MLAGSDREPEKMSSQESGFSQGKKVEDVNYNIPDGGLEAWLVVLGSSFTFFMAFGLISTFGVFQEYYVSNLLRGKSNSSESAVSWIGSMQVFCMFIGGIPFGALFDRFGCRPLMIGGCVTYVAACMLVSLCDEWYQIFLSQAVLLGIAIASLFCAPFSVVTHWFDKNLGIALGLITCGSSVGGVVWPIALRHMFDSIGFGWTFRIVGFIGLGVLIPASIVIKNRVPTETPKALLNLKEFKNPTFTLFGVGQFFNIFGMFFVMFYTPTLARYYGLSQDMSWYALSILNGVSFFGRVTAGLLGDKLGPLNVMFFASFSSGVITLCTLALNSGTGVVILAAFYGFVSGAIISIMGSCIARVSADLNLIGTNTGMLMGLVSLGGLLGAPVSGWLVEYRDGVFDSAEIFPGCMLLIGSMFVLASKITINSNPFART